MTLLQGAQEFGAVLDTLQIVLEYVGTVAFAISGALVASRKGMDVGGMVSLGAIVSVGGGTTRDLLLGRSVFWVEDPTFLALGAVTALLVIPVAHLAGTRVARAYPLIQTFDAIGLALFVVTSTSIALSAGASEVSAATIGVVAGIGGGVIRDVLANEVPQVLVDRRLYITAALAGSIAYLVLLRWEAPEWSRCGCRSRSCSCCGWRRCASATPCPQCSSTSRRAVARTADLAADSPGAADAH